VWKCQANTKFEKAKSEGEGKGGFMCPIFNLKRYFFGVSALRSPPQSSKLRVRHSVRTPPTKESAKQYDTLELHAASL